MANRKNKTGNNMARIKIAIRRNNAALAMIEANRYMEAIGVLKALIQEFRDDLKPQVEYQDTRHSEPCSVLIHRLLLKGARTMMDKRGGEEEEYFLYNQPVEIPQRVALETHTVAANVITSVLLFNLALAFQLKAIAVAKQTNRPNIISDRCFEKSMKLYQLATALNSNRLFSVVVLNNVALIHQRYNDYEKAQVCFHHLLSIWISMSPAFPNELQGMVHNAMGLYDTSALPAAAA